MLTTTTTSVNINVSNDTKGGGNMKRKKIHPEYVFVRAYQKLFKYTDEQMGDKLACTARTYNEKVLGWADFSSLEAKELSRIFNVSQDTLFLTQTVSNGTKSA